MPRINIYLSEETKNRLADYRYRVWDSQHLVSAIIQRAIKEFLDREDAREAEGKSNEGLRDPK